MPHLLRVRVRERLWWRRLLRLCEAALQSADGRGYQPDVQPHPSTAYAQAIRTPHADAIQIRDARADGRHRSSVGVGMDNDTPVGDDGATRAIRGAERSGHADLFMSRRPGVPRQRVRRPSCSTHPVAQHGASASVVCVRRCKQVSVCTMSDVVEVGTNKYLVIRLEAVKQKQLQRTSNNITLTLKLAAPWKGATSVDVVASRGCMATASTCLGGASAFAAFRFQCDPLPCTYVCTLTLCMACVRFRCDPYCRTRGARDALPDRHSVSRGQWRGARAC